MGGMWMAPETRLWAIRRYLAVIAVGSLIWEFVQMPLYTLWRTGTPGEIVFAAVHCAGGDVMIATAALVLALIPLGHPDWPRQRFLPVAITVLGLGLGYTVFSEWLNVEVRRTWAYTELMPVLPWLGTGLSPLAQWIIVPGLALWNLRPGAPALSRRVGAGMEGAHDQT
ncbi:MAG TPA: hypothetical protein VD978_00950 [Azospirillum sp.]|nr:hypothetical protein [Azospirillum sp.]